MTDENDKGFVRTVLTGLFETIAEMDERDQQRRSGRASARSGRARFDYGLDIGIGPPADVAEEASERPVDDTDHAATVHSAGEGYVVTVDLPNVDPTELSAGVDESARRLLIADDGGVIERVDLPDERLDVADASFNNGILDVHLRRRGER
jgi:HSP20 family molecular chaperone IbpA